MKLCNSVKYISHKCELFIYCYMLFELAYELNISVHRRKGRHFTGGRKKVALKITICPKNRQLR